ncbi:MAG: alanine racemase [Nitrospinae bacterium]|nr:alanine racemase [Nitrospinota bacterium]
MRTRSHWDNRSPWRWTARACSTSPSPTSAKKAAREGKQAGLHLKIDTGMSRLGAAPEAFPELAEFVGKSKNLRIESVFTHLSSADEDPEYTLLQLSRFDDILSKVKSMGIDINLAHCANSAALLTFPQSQYDMVRPGIITYGALPSPNLKPQAKELFSGDNDAEGPLPVMQWKTGILQINSLPENTPLSYGQKFVTARESLIATLPVGYADGLSRGLSNKMKVLVRGQRAPQVGTICMDMCMIDVTDIPDAQIGDEVVIFGKQGDESITADELAGWQETVSHEILTAVAQRVPRKYLP